MNPVPPVGMRRSSSVLIKISLVPFERSECKRRNGVEKRMQLRKLSVVLLALLLAAMAMVPYVSAEDQNTIMSLDSANTPISNEIIEKIMFLKKLLSNM